MTGLAVRMALAAALLMAMPAVAEAAERVLSFHSDVRIAANGELTVTETITVHAEGARIRRGILRDFPTDYQDRIGRRVTVPFDVLSVTRDGAPEPFVTERMDNGVRVRIGRADVTLPPGRHVYELAYRTAYQVGFFDGQDELYWNVNGNGWAFPMDVISADVTLPSAVAAGALRLVAYTGRFGARGTEYAAETRDGGATFRTTRELGPAEGLTIVVMFPKGVVTPPSWPDRVRLWRRANPGEAAGAAGLLLLLAFLGWRWWRVGRDPRRGLIFPRYEAPRGLGPAGVRFLDRMRCDDRCFAASLLGLGQRGYLRIEKAGDGYLVERTGRKVEQLPEEAPVAELVPPGGVLALSRTHEPAVERARTALAAALERRYGTRLFSRNRGSLVIGLALAAAAVAAMIVLGTAVAVVVGAAVTMVVVLVLFAWLLPAYSAYGRRLEDEIEGLRLYLSVAEKDDLARQKRPPRTPEEFAKFLPYAVALAVEKTWAEEFTKVLGAAALAAAVSSYYRSDEFDRFSSDSSPGSLGHFTDSISDFGRTISAASTAPGSTSGGSSGDSGGGGGDSGGSSGGGGGGGGGDGW